MKPEEGYHFFLTQVIKFLIAVDREGFKSHLHRQKKEKTLMRFGAIFTDWGNCSILWVY